MCVCVRALVLGREEHRHRKRKRGQGKEKRAREDQDDNLSSAMLGALCPGHTDDRGFSLGCPLTRGVVEKRCSEVCDLFLLWGGEGLFVELLQSLTGAVGKVTCGSLVHRHTGAHADQEEEGVLVHGMEGRVSSSGIVVVVM